MRGDDSRGGDAKPRFHQRDHREEEKLRRKEKRTIAAAPTKRGIGRLRAVW